MGVENLRTMSIFETLLMLLLLIVYNIFPTKDKGKLHVRIGVRPKWKILTQVNKTFERVALAIL